MFFICTASSWSTCPPVSPLLFGVPICTVTLLEALYRNHVQAGFEPASFRSGRMCSYHWATGTSTLTLLFFGVLSFLIGQNQLNFCKSEIWTQVSHTKVQRSDRWATGAVFFFFFFGFMSFWGGWGFMFTSYWSFVFLLKCYSFMSKPLATSQQRCSTSLEHILLRSNVCWFCLHVNWTHDLEIVSHVLSGELHEVEYFNPRKPPRPQETLNFTSVNRLFSYWVCNPKLPHISKNSSETSCFASRLSFAECLIVRLTAYLFSILSIVSLFLIGDTGVSYCLLQTETPKRKLNCLLMLWENTCCLPIENQNQKELYCQVCLDTRNSSWCEELAVQKEHSFKVFITTVTNYCRTIASFRSENALKSHSNFHQTHSCLIM